MFIDKVINPLSVNINGVFRPVFCSISFKDDKLSISGVVAPRSNGDAYGSAGQMYDDLIDKEPKKYTEGWSKQLVAEFVEVWKEWHLNDLQAGTPKQMEAIKNWEKAGHKYNYDEAVEFLKTAGLYDDNGYIYGSAWLKKEVPLKVLEFLNALPDSKKVPAWV